MADSGPGESGRIFISYRRDDAAYPAGWLFDRLADHFGAGQVFKDVDSIELGDDFVEVITGAVASCAVLLAVIGPRWLSVTDEDGRRRLDSSEDFVRLEIEAALKRGVRIIPVLVEGARMPQPAELPESLRGLARRQALQLSPSRFAADCVPLIKVLDKTIAAVTAGPATASSGGQLGNVRQGTPGAPHAQPSRADGKPAGEADARLREARARASLFFSALDPPITERDQAPVTGPRPDDQRPGRAYSRLTGKLIGHAAQAEPAIAGVLSSPMDDVAFPALSRERLPVGDIAFSPDGALLAAVQDGVVRLWDVAARTEAGVLAGAKVVRGVAFSPDGGLLAAAGSDDALRLWDVAGRVVAATSDGASGGLCCVTFSPDGHLVAAGTSDGTVRLRNGRTAAPAGPLGPPWRTDPPGRMLAVAFSPDGELMAGGGTDATVWLWDTQWRRVTQTLTGHAGSVYGVAFSPDGGVLASAGDDGTVRLWPVPASAGDDGTVRLWPVPAGAVARVLTGGGGAVYGVAFSPDGGMLACAEDSGTVRLWDWAAGTVAGVLTGGGGRVYCVAFSPDGALLAAGSSDRAIRLWGPGADRP